MLIFQKLEAIADPKVKRDDYIFISKEFSFQSNFMAFTNSHLNVNNYR